MKKHLFALLVLSLIIQCKSEAPELYFPTKPESMSNGKYVKYASLLDTAYQKKDYYSAAFQMANLKADKQYVFDFLTKAVKDSSQNCQKIFESYHHFQQDFLNNLVKTDTNEFIKVFELCKSLVGADGYDLYLENYNKQVAEHQASKEVLDSTKFDLKLVEELEAIHNSDQEVRKRFTKRSNTQAEKDAISKEMRIIDSVNVKKVLALIEKNGYPSKYVVGRDGVFTPVLVLHHHGNVQQKRKYRKILQKAVDDGLLGQGALNMFDTRLNSMVLDEDSEP